MKKRDILRKVNYYYIIDKRLDLQPYEQAKIAVENNVGMIQYRAKDTSDKEMYKDCVRVRKVIPEDVLFIVNDRVDIALAVDADGVHLGQDDLPFEVARELVEDDTIIGISTHDLNQAKSYEKIADYIGIGPVHTTETKDDTSEELGLDGVLEIASDVDVPTTAIGGIEEEDLEELAKGVDMACAISSVTQKGDLSERIGLFESKFSQAKRGV
ncbi:MAG: thiamine phosphate synthase [Thermoplasmatota archaeon]